MRCPACSSSLDPAMGPGGNVVDLCRACGGVWLDKGELFHYTSNARRAYELLRDAYRKTSPSARPCPRCEVPMRCVQVPSAVVVLEACPGCGGNWLDKGEMQAFQKAASAELGLEAAAVPAMRAKAAPAASEARRASPRTEAGTPAASRRTAPAPAVPRGAPVLLAAPLPGLPSLALRSGGVLAGLYGLLAAFLVLAGRFLELGAELAIGVSVAAAAFGFLVSPWLHDLSLRWLHAFQWIEPSALPEGARRFLQETCRARGIPVPRLGLIEDGNPNAFTYGHGPSNARLVVTRGLLELLDEEELNGVLGHELGHALHWDMALMSAAAVVPVILYQVYRMCMRSRRPGRSSGKDRNPLPAIGLAAYVLYVVTEYVVLFLSRTRELYADRFGAEATGRPNALASALGKIAYGLAGGREGTAVERASAGALDAARVMGIFDPASAKALVASAGPSATEPSLANLAGAMQWDLWNPWASFHELGSTHPLPARRIQLLGRQAEAYGQEPLVRFDERQPESYWDEFLVDLLFHFAPLLGAGLGAGAAALAEPSTVGAGPAALAGLALGGLLRTAFAYRGSFFPEATVAALLKKVKVSGVRGVPAELSGTVIGRGSPGYVLSEDVVLQDRTGFLYLDYRQPLALLDWLFAITRVPELIGRGATARGYYRRGPVPCFEVRELRWANKTSRCYALEAKVLFWLALLGGAAWWGWTWR